MKNFDILEENSYRNEYLQQQDSILNESLFKKKYDFINFNIAYNELIIAHDTMIKFIKGNAILKNIDLLKQPKIYYFNIDKNHDSVYSFRLYMTEKFNIYELARNANVSVNLVMKEIYNLYNEITNTCEYIDLTGLFNNGYPYQLMLDLNFDYALGCKYYDKFNGFDNINDYDISNLGICKRVKGNDLHCMFIDGYGYETNKDLIDEHIEELKKEYDRLIIADDQVDREKDLFQIKKRIATLTKSMATLYVGGNSEMEKKTRHFLMEDAVYACRSSIEYGYVVGGNLVLPKIIHIFKDEIIDKVIEHQKLGYLKNLFTTDDELKNAMYLVINEIYNAFLICFKIVLQNARIPDKDIEKIIDSCINDNLIYNVKLRRYESDKDTIVINSAETDIEIIKASFSIIGLLATSNQFITTNPIYQN